MMRTAADSNSYHQSLRTSLVPSKFTLHTTKDSARVLSNEEDACQAISSEGNGILHQDK